MKNRVPALALSLMLASPAAAQEILYAVQANGDILHINPATGAASLLTSTGIETRAAAPYTFLSRYSTSHYVLFGGRSGTQANEIWRYDPSIPSVGIYLTATNWPAGYQIRGMTRGSYDSLYLILSTESPAGIDLLAQIQAGACTIIGPTGRTDLEALTRSRMGVLYALGTADSGRIYTINPGTGEATAVGGPAGFAEEVYTLEFMTDGTLLAAGANLHSVNLATGAATLIGPTGYAEIHGLAAAGGCYPNCTTGGPPPYLNVADFGCFLSKFAAGDLYANCDMSTTPPVLNVADFGCFLQAFLTGCH